MPKIKPFNGIKPNPVNAGNVVLDIENLSLQEAKIIRQDNPYSYVNMLVPKLDNVFLRGSKNELAFKKINENFEEFLEKGVLIRDSKPSIYVYRVTRDGITQTGIWTVTSIDDYLSNKIKKHELTRPERETVLIDYLQQTGIDANPVLITYGTVPAINEVISTVCQAQPDLSFSKTGALHQLWKTDETSKIGTLVTEFANISSVYLADGHHRAAAASLLALKQRKLNPNYTSDEEFNFFTSVYMAFDQLIIYPFHRLVKNLKGNSTTSFINELNKYFKVEHSLDIVAPDKLHHFGMYMGGIWYKLTANTFLLAGCDPVSILDVSILQNHIFKAILNIQEPRTDPVISFAGGILPIEDLVEMVDQGKEKVLFTLFPTSIDQLVKVADQGGLMPPKSTWFEPKFQVGLLIHKIN